MLTQEECLRLQKLAAISLTDQESVKLSTQLSTIVDFLSKLQSLPASSFPISSSSSLEMISGVVQYGDPSSLFTNSKHEKIGNTIVITSVIDN